MRYLLTAWRGIYQYASYAFAYLLGNVTDRFQSLSDRVLGIRWNLWNVFLGVTCSLAGIAGFGLAVAMMRLAIWTARKDFYQLCRTELVRVSLECVRWP